MLKDFKAFIARGNVLDLAIAVILGAAFGAIVKTFTDGIIMPFVGLATGGVDFKSKFYDLSGTVPTNATPEQIETAIKGGTPLVIVRPIYQRHHYIFDRRDNYVLSCSLRGQDVQPARSGSVAAHR